MIRRMFGNMLDPDIFHYETFDGQKIHHRGKRSTRGDQSATKVDACESTVEIVTPYWASNSQGRIRAIVNTQHLQLAIQQVCIYTFDADTQFGRTARPPVDLHIRRR